MKISISPSGGGLRGVFRAGGALCLEARNHNPYSMGARLSLLILTAVLVGCGGSSSSSSSDTSTSTSSTAANTHGIVVNSGPIVNGAPVGRANTLYSPIVLCLPGSNTCVDVFNLQISTAFTGLRIFSSALAFNLTLPQSNDANGNPIANCGRNADGSYFWGPVGLADIKIEGEVASSVPVQVLGTNFAAAPASCAGSGTALNNVTALGANGILGIGMFKQDCGAACTSLSTQNPPVYYSCPASGCVPVAVPLAQQLQNVVAMFPKDNNGVLITLPSVGDSGSGEVRGTIQFGIGTQADNTIGTTPTVLKADAQGRIFVAFNGANYSGTFDTGSSATTFPNTPSIPLCVQPSLAKFYCPTSNLSFSAINTGTSGTSASVAFGVANALSLSQVGFGLNKVFSNLAGVNSSGVTWGLPFFFGRTVYVGIDGQTATTSATTPVTLTGPYVAY